MSKRKKQREGIEVSKHWERDGEIGRGKKKENEGER
jgi:hypothetical protein